MGTLFHDVESKHLEPNWAFIIDWLFDETRFESDSWNSNAKGRFTRAISSSRFFDESSFGKKTRVHKYPIYNSKRNRKKKPFAVFSSRESLGVDFLKHIRNGIAHGNAEWYTANGKDYIQIRDSHNGHQTGFIAIPISYLNEFRLIYVNIENQASRSTSTI